MRGNFVVVLGAGLAIVACGSASGSPLLPTATAGSAGGGGTLSAGAATAPVVGGVTAGLSPAILGGSGGTPTLGTVAGAGTSFAGLASFAGAAGGTPQIADCAPHQPILSNLVPNARDLGGTLLSAGQVACQRLYRGSPLADLTEEGCQQVVALGLRRVVDLRTTGEAQARPDSSCVTTTSPGVSAPLPIPYGGTPEAYLADLAETGTIRQVFTLLGSPDSYPVYLHCTYGRDRTGIIVALVLLALGAGREEIQREYLLSQAQVGAYPESLTAVLDEVDRQGGILTFLAQSGVTPEQLAVLRAELQAPSP